MDKHYSIDPGKGEKMEGCPYSIFEDGRDVQEYIIPPKGYIFTGFRFEPLTNNQIYDGKLVALYEKTSIKERLSSDLWKILIPVIIIAVITAVVLLAVSVFRGPRPPKQEPSKTPTETIVANTDTLPVLPTNTIQETDSVVPEKADDTTDLPETISQQEENQQAEETEDQQTEETPQPSDDPNLQFKKEFWNLIHERTIMMDPYHELYVNNKNKVSGEEYDYLRFVILKDYVSFKAWYEKLRKIPENQLKSIETVDALKNTINAINE